MKICSACACLWLTAFVIGTATAQTVAENTLGTYSQNLTSSFYVGQSFTTANDGTADLLGTIYLLTSGGSASGSGTLYLFSSAYPGTASNLSTTTTNLLGSAIWNSSSNFWDLSAANITLNAGAQYFFYVAPTADLNFGFGSTNGSDAVDLYAGGEYYVSPPPSDNPFFSQPSDLDFRVTGTAVPEPSTYAAVLGVMALGIGLLKRRAGGQA